MLCLGNICRSPLAEGILRSKLDENFIIDSAGTANYHTGSAPDGRSIGIAQKYGIDIAHQKAKQLREKDFHEFDVIYAMDKSNLRDALAIAPKGMEHKVKLILKENPRASVEDVPDPYYGGEDGFENVYHLLNEACDVIVEKLLK